MLNENLTTMSLGLKEAKDFADVVRDTCAFIDGLAGQVIPKPVDEYIHDWVSATYPRDRFPGAFLVAKVTSLRYRCKLCLTSITAYRVVVSDKQ